MRGGRHRLGGAAGDLLNPVMTSAVTYTHWHLGDDEAVLPFLLKEAWVAREAYLHKFDDPLLEPKGVHLAWQGSTVVGHVMTCRRPVFMEGRVQLLGGIGQMLVAENLRGTGVGRTLLHRALEYLTGKGCRAVSLRTNTGLQRALKFYSAAGFRLWAEEVVHTLDTGSAEANTGLALRTITPDEAMPVRLEWARSNFPVCCDARAFRSRDNLLGGWEDGRLVGYLEHDGEKVNDAAVVGASAAGMIRAALTFAAQRGADTIAWHTAANGFWDQVLRQFSNERKVTVNIRLLRPLGPDLDPSTQRPSWATIHTW